MKIAICDDCELQIEYFKHRIEPFLIKNGDHSYSINGYFSGKPLIDDVKDGKWFDMIVLDVVLKNENGVEIAKELRACGYKGGIAFWTAHKEFVFDALDVEPTHYIIKGNEHGRMFSVLDTTLNKVKHKMLTVRRKDCIIRIPLNKIEYLEARDKRVFIHCANGIQHSTADSLKEIQKSLDNRFLRCYRSYVINMDYVAKIDKDFTMLSGDAVLICKSKCKEITDCYVNYIEKYEEAGE